MSGSAALAFLTLLTAASQSKAGTILASYSGSYTSLSASPVTDGVVSLRLSVGPMFADCDTDSACTELAHLNGLDWLDAGSQFILNKDAITTVLSNGTIDIFSLAMNFGPVFSSTLSGGAMGMFDSILDGSYSIADIDMATFTIDQLLFRPVSTPFGTNTEATLRYSLVLWDHSVQDVGDEFPTQVDDVGPGSPPPVTSETPEPSTWLLLTGGALFLFQARRSLFRL